MPPFYPARSRIALFADRPRLPGLCWCLLGAALLSLVMICAGGCSATRALPEVQRIEAAEFGTVTDDVRGGTAYVVGKADDSGRVESDIVRSFERSSWAKLRSSVAADASADSPRWAAAAVMPDGRTAYVIARRSSAGVVSIAVRVGAFGDEASERGYARVLAGSLVDKARPKRDHTFTLPEWNE